MAIKRFEIIPRKFWKSNITGQIVSLYGAHPAVNTADQVNWTIVTEGLVYRDNRSGRVHGNPDMRTEETIDAFLTKFHGKDWRDLEI